MKNALRAALDDRGYTTLTPVQDAVSDPDLTGRDLLVSAQTGSGKTLGFGLAIAPTLLQDEEQFEPAAAPLALIIAPTRELALQVKRELGWLFAKAGAVLASCVGGMDMRDERRALARGAHIVVATPGRLRDHIMRGSINLSAIRSVVLDEADEMLDLGFREDLEFILSEAPEERQTLMFSATVPKSIAALAKSYQKDAVRVDTKSNSSQHADIEYKAYGVAERDTENAVINTLLYYQAPNAIVFGNTRAMVNRLTTRLSNRGFKVVALSGELSQSERTHALQAMRDGRAQVCVATDVAARGIDLPNLDLVVHAELPSNHETLLHRSGRTGRAGRKGVSALIVTRKSRKKAERILGTAKVKADWTSVPSAAAVRTRQEDRMLDDPSWQTPTEANEQETIDKMLPKFTPEQLATAYLRLYRTMHSSPEEVSEVDDKPKPRTEFGASVWFSISGGRAAGAEPRRLLPMLCKVSGLNSDDIGAIRVQQTQSYVQIKATSVPTFLAGINDDMTLERGAVLTQLAEPPVLDSAPHRGKKKPGKPRRHDDAKPKEYARPKKPDATPTDWNDEPAPRKKKPKPQDRAKPPHKAKPAHKDKPQHRDKPQESAKSQPRAKPQDGAKPQSRAKPQDTGKSQQKRANASETFRGESSGGNARPRRPDPKAAKNRKPKDKSGGPPPPSGKPSSKKNRARALAAKNARKSK